eukprot:TRINITY_DN4937_c0_g1_i1.p2 TRINITY_DN4937_c0_g1~~TRINITY_DN4937_c0_g1_i1.p2  ORF type:complete len:259 (+),score=57.76 TRINITY_DN4937_c0_g1_i1:1183-1959(+)
MDQYFQVFEKATPNFVTHVWLDDEFMAQVEFKGRSTDQKELKVPMQYIVDEEEKEEQQESKKEKMLVMQKDGDDGRLYYRIGLNYAPKLLELEPYNNGFTVTRSYDFVDDKDDVKKGNDGKWIIKAGARVRVRLGIASTKRRYHVALVDFLPAGLEALNPALKGTGDVPPDPDASSSLTPRRCYWQPMHWYQHQNFRDERVEAFSTLMYPGSYKYSFVCRATTVGKFVAPPTKAEEMYTPEVFGRAQSDNIVIVRKGK